MKRLLLIGPPGAGKTVIANKLSEEFNIPFIKTGSLLRELSQDDPNYMVIKKSMEMGELAPNSIVGAIVRSEVNKNQKGFILDGWLRQLSDFEIYNPELDLVIFLDCKKDISKDRILNRVVCKIHGSIYSYSAQVCHFCKGELEKRSDDTEETFEKRWRVYENLTLPVLEYFRDKNMLITIDATKSVQEIVAKIKSSLI